MINTAFNSDMAIRTPTLTPQPPAPAIVGTTPGDDLVDAYLVNGHHVVLRSAHDGDEDALGALYTDLSNESSHLRFFTIRRRIPPEDLHRWVTRQFPDHLTVLVAPRRRRTGRRR